MNTMRAVVQDTYGTADVLHLAQVDRPEIAANEVLVQVAGGRCRPGHGAPALGQALRDAGHGVRVPEAEEPGAGAGCRRHASLPSVLR